MTNDDSVDEEQLLNRLLSISDTHARQVLLDEACQGNPSLRRRLVEQLDAYDASLDAAAVPPKPDDFTLELATGTTSRQESTQQIGPYRLLEQLGEGGMGAVFMAEQDRPVRRHVAVKIIKPGMDSRQIIARFEAERQALAMMDHENIARVFDAGTTPEGRPYFVMELVKGLPITDYCDQRRLSLRARLELFVSTCQAIQHAHQKGIVHRDIKPSNVLVTDLEGAAVPKVIDFGLAKALQQPLTERSLHTQIGQVLGTLEYMSPEQAGLNALDIDTRTDLYSLGVLLYELLTGTTPIGRERLKTAAFDRLLEIIREEEPSRPSTRVGESGDSLPDISDQRRTEPHRLSALFRGDLDAIVMKALEKDRNRRYDSPASFSADVLRYLRNEPIEARPPSATYRISKFVQRNRLVVTGVALLLLSLVAGSVGTLVGWRRALAANQRTAEAEALANQRFQQAREAVDQFFTEVSNDPRLLQRTPGTQELRRKLLTRASDYYQRFLKDAETDASVRQEAAAASFRLGEITFQLDPGSEQGLAYYRQAADLFRKQRETSPLAPEFASMEAQALRGIGAVYLDANRYDEAIAALKECVATTERIIAEHGNTDDRITLAKALHNIGLTYRRKRESKPALEYYLRALELAEPIIAEHDKNPEYLFQVSNMHSNTGILYSFGLGDAKTALIHSEKAVAMRERLLELQPGRHDYENALAGGYNNVALVYHMNQRVDDCRMALVKAAAIRERLVQENPGVAAYAEELAQTYGNLASLSAESGDTTKAFEYWTKELTLFKALVAQHPRMVRYAINIARDAEDMAGVQYQTGLRKQALQSIKEVIAFHRQLRDRQPDSPVHTTNLIKLLGAVPKTLEDAQELLPLSEELMTGEKPDHRQLTAAALASYRNQEYQQAHDLLTKVDATEPGALWLLVKSLTDWQLGNQDEATSGFEQAAKLIGEEKWPDIVDQVLLDEARALVHSGQGELGSD